MAFPICAFNFTRIPAYSSRARMSSVLTLLASNRNSVVLNLGEAKFTEDGSQSLLCWIAEAE